MSFFRYLNLKQLFTKDLIICLAIFFAIFAPCWGVAHNKFLGFLNPHIVLTLSAEKQDMLQVFLDNGNGCTEQNSSKAYYDSNISQNIKLSIPNIDFKILRIDPAVGENIIDIHSIELYNNSFSAPIPIDLSKIIKNNSIKRIENTGHRLKISTSRNDPQFYYHVDWNPKKQIYNTLSVILIYTIIIAALIIFSKLCLAFWGFYSNNVRLIIVSLISLVIVFIPRYNAGKSDAALNVDESLVAAAAISIPTLGNIPWRDFDTTTIGPINVWFVWFFSVLGFDISYTNLHALSAIVISITFFTAVFCIGKSIGNAGALIAMILSFYISIITLNNDYLHFTSGILSSLFLTIGALFVILTFQNSLSKYQLLLYPFIIGFSCAAAGLGKLQAAPICACLSTSVIWFPSSCSMRQRAIMFTLIICGGLFVLLPLALILLINGELDLAYLSYVKASASYGVGAYDHLFSISSIIEILEKGWGWLHLLYAPFVLALFLIVVLQKPFNSNSYSSLFLMAAFLFLSALVSCFLPVRRFGHHGVFLISPAIMLLSSAIVYSASLVKSNAGFKNIANNIQNSYSYRVLVIITSVFCFFSYKNASTKLNSITSSSNVSQSDFCNEIVNEINSNSCSESSIAVWGWAPELFVLSGRPSASRHMISHFLIDENPAQKIHQHNFLEDIRKNQPDLIIDALADGFFKWTWGSGDGKRLASVVEMDSFLKSNYSPPLHINKSEGSTPVFIYKKLINH